MSFALATQRSMKQAQTSREVICTSLQGAHTSAKAVLSPGETYTLIQEKNGVVWVEGMQLAPDGELIGHYRA